MIRFALPERRCYSYSRWRRDTNLHHEMTNDWRNERGNKNKIKKSKCIYGGISRAELSRKMSGIFEKVN